MQEYSFSVLRANDWKEFKDMALSFSENWAFRGQANGSWLLNNAIERTHFVHHHPTMEANFVAEFQRGASNYLTKDQMPSQLIEWLALMQHHGAPTRLLDLSWSPFVASFFAFENCPMGDTDTVGIWCIHIEYLKQRATELLADHFGQELDRSQNLINEELFGKIFYQNNLRLVFPIEPFRMNRRYSLQQSVFLSTGTSSVPLMDQLLFLGDQMKQAVVKIEVPTVHKKTVLRELQLMNLHRASLFPDLDGYAASLKLRYDSMKTPQEMAAQQRSKASDGNYPFLP
jgi:hypothetical protein